MSFTEKKSPADELERAAEIFRERQAVYGKNWIQFGPMMHEIFPEGLKIETAEEWARLGILIQVANKFTRICQTFKKGGHIDSSDDLAVYASMYSFLTNYKVDLFGPPFPPPLGSRPLDSGEPGPQAGRRPNEDNMEDFE